MQNCRTKFYSNRMIVRYCFIFLLLCCIIHARAQQYSYLKYGTKEGLVQSQAKCLFQDRQGFLWVGTVGGVSRFDGKQFKSFTRQEGLLSNQINVIAEENNGTILLGGNGCLSKINGIGIRNFPLPPPLNEATVNALLVQGDTTWIGTEKGLCSLVNEQIISCENVLGSEHIKSIVKDKQYNRLLILTKEKVYRWSNASLELHYSPMVSTTQFFDLTQAIDGQWWLATKGEGLVQLSSDGLRSKNFLENEGLFTTSVTTVLPAPDGSLWLSSRNGFLRYRHDQFILFDQENGLDVTDVRDLLLDREGNLWLATYGGGLKRLASQEMVSYTKRDGLSSNAVMSILEDKQGAFWLSTFDAGLHLLQKDTIRPQSTGALNSRTWCSMHDSQGRLWFGTSEGLLMRINERWKLFTKEDGLIDNLVLSLLEDQSGRVWVGTSKGICIFDADRFLSMDAPGYPSKRIRSMVMDRHGQIWIAALDGVFKHDSQGFHHYTTDHGLMEASSYCIAVDPHNRIWVGTSFGLSLWNGQNFESRLISSVNGGNVINFIQFNRGKAWLGTNEGLFMTKIREALSLRAYDFVHFDVEDGLVSNETNLNSGYIDRLGRLWFGTSEGLMLLPNELLERPAIAPPGLSLYDLQINLTPQNWTSFGDARDVQTGLPLQLDLKYFQNDLTFYFSGISITFPKTVEYQYMLAGLDEDWKPVTPNAFATYSGLAPNQYLFIVRTRHQGGDWSLPISYAFTIQPPFWLRWWFIMCMVVLMVTLIVWVFNNRNRMIRTKRERELYKIKNRMLALEQQSLNSSMNRHFIFNALNSIQYYINRQDRLAANKYLTDFAKLIRKNLDSSQDNLTTLGDEIERLEIYLRLEHMRFKDKFEYHVEVDPLLSSEKIKVPAMLIQPFLENSIWHGLLPKDDGEVGELTVSFHLVDSHVELEIRDNGIGIESSLRRKTSADSHISKGMEITKSRIDLIKKTTGKIIELTGPQDIRGADGLSKGTIVKIKLSDDFHKLF
jgi:ligand-binding sensor domain-containing protein/two-component sensor histidine kinase